jgi:hypothetical protein
MKRDVKVEFWISVIGVTIIMYIVSAILLSLSFIGSKKVMYRKLFFLSFSVSLLLSAIYQYRMGNSIIAGLLIVWGLVFPVLGFRSIKNKNLSK